MGSVCRVWSAGRVAPLLCLCRKCVVSDSGAGVLLGCSSRLRQALSGGGSSGVVGCADFAVSARLGPARPNSLRSLRSLRSDSGRESDNEARTCAPGPRRADTATPEHRPHRTAPAAARCGVGSPPVDRQYLFCQGVCAQAAARRVRRREAQWPWPRAQRASSTDLSHLSERRERSERSELCDGPRPRASQGSRRAAPTASPKRCGLPAHALARGVQ